MTVSEPRDHEESGRPDRVLPILNMWGLVGEIQIWRGEFLDLPAEDSSLLQNFVSQAAGAFERVQSMKTEQKANDLLSTVNINQRMTCH